MTAGKSNSAGKSVDRELVITRIFDAPRKLVFAAWTKKEHLTRWSAPKGFTIPFSEGDARPGGAWKACMRTPEGEDLWLSGIYREVVEDEWLVFTHAWEEKGQRGHETIVTVRFTDHGKKTKMVFHQGPFESVGERDGHTGGWNQCFDRLAGLLAIRRTWSGKRKRIVKV
jgi:uncharacterized protein YndB with AHSA1/START domain